MNIININKVKRSVGRLFTYQLSLVAAALMLLTACDDPNEGELFVTPSNARGEMSIVDVLESRDYNGQFSMWVELLRGTNYYNALKNASATATVFCPTNEAMTKFLNSRGLENVQELLADMDYAKAVVQEHIINGEKYFDNQVDMLAKEITYIPAKNLYGEYLNLSYGYMKTDCDDVDRPTDYQVTDSIWINDQARLARFEVDTCQNGVFYIMADVIKPLAETIYERLASDTDYTIFAEAMKDCGYDSIANKYCDTTWVQGGTFVPNTYSYTCFAVADDVFKAKGINDAAGLKRYIVANSSDTYADENEALNKYMQYHFLKRDYTTAELFNFLGDEELLVYPVNLKGQSVIANRTAAGKVLNNTVNIIRSDTKTRNGYIHKVDDVMLVYHPTPTVMKWDFLNSPDLISIVNAYGANSGDGNLFSTPLGNDNSKKFDFVSDANLKNYGTPESFTFKKEQSSASTGKYPSIGFWKDFYSSGTTPAYGAYMNNFLSLNLGFGGYVEFTTPSIIAGKYKIVLHYLADKGNMTLVLGMLTSGTSVRFTLDNDIKTHLLYKGTTFPKVGKKTADYAALSITLWDSMEFLDSDSHTFRITLRDVLAKTNKDYHISLDYVEFIPVQ